MNTFLSPYFSDNTIYYYRQFYQTFPEIFPTVCGILSWSHYKRLLTVTNPEARAWYLKEAQEQMWSYRTLDRNIGSQYYERAKTINRLSHILIITTAS